MPKYQCEYGPQGFSTILKEIFDENISYKNYPKVGKVVPNESGHSIKRDSLAQWGPSIKEGCEAEFIVNVLYFLCHIAFLSFIEVEHCNQYGLHVHDKEKPGDRSAFAAHLSKDIKTWVAKQLDLNLNVSQVMAIHRSMFKTSWMVVKTSHVTSSSLTKSLLSFE